MKQRERAFEFELKLDMEEGRVRDVPNPKRNPHLKEKRERMDREEDGRRADREKGARLKRGGWEEE